MLPCLHVLLVRARSLRAKEVQQSDDILVLDETQQLDLPVGALCVNLVDQESE